VIAHLHFLRVFSLKALLLVLLGFFCSVQAQSQSANAPPSSPAGNNPSQQKATTVQQKAVSTVVVKARKTSSATSNSNNKVSNKGVTNSQNGGIQDRSKPGIQIRRPTSALVDSNAEDDVLISGAGNLDYRVQRGCARRNFLDSQLPEQIGIENKQFIAFFETQAKAFFSRVRGNCIPYALALGKRNRFESLSLLTGNVRDAQAEIWTFTPAAFDGFLLQQERLINELGGLSEIEIPLSAVLYDPNQVENKLPIELVWELNAVVKQIYTEESGAAAQTNNIVRVIVDYGDREQWAQIWAVEIITPKTKEVLASAFWLDRTELPGGFYTPNGESLERALWTTPLSYRRISRGVGMVPTSRKKTAAVTSKTNTVQAPPTSTRYRAHMGIDYSAPTGTPVFSVATGKVVARGYNGAFGNLLILEHPGGYRTYYAHLSNFNAELDVGNEVRRGFEIGYVGNTGRSTGPHLHFELRKDGVYLNPYNPNLQLDLWTMINSDSGQFTKLILLFSS